MGAVVVLAILLATALVIASGLWVAVVLVATVVRVERPATSANDPTPNGPD